MVDRAPLVSSNMLTETTTRTNPVIVGPATTQEHLPQHSLASCGADTLDKNFTKQNTTIDTESSHHSARETNSTNSMPPGSNRKAKEPSFHFGPYIPIIRRETDILIDPKGIVSSFKEAGTTSSGNRQSWDVHPDDAILDAPSIITPLLLKKKTIWPPKETVHLKQKHSDPSSVDINNDTSDDVQVVKVVNSEISKATEVQVSNNKSIEEYVKATTVASLTHMKPLSNNPILTINDYHKSSVGELLIGIGLSRVREFNLEEGIKRLKSKIKRGETSLTEDLEALRGELMDAKSSNKVYKSDQLLRCPHCPFKSEFSTVMSGHLEIPHLTSKREFMCNRCDYKVKDCNQIVFHNLVEHKQRCRIEKPPTLHLCRYCPYECRSKRKMITHLNRCEPAFQLETHLGPEFGENEFPAVSSKFIFKQDVKAYEHTLKTLRLAAYNPHQLKVSNGQLFGQRTALIVPRQDPSSSSASNLNAPNQNGIDTSNNSFRASVGDSGNGQYGAMNSMNNQHTSAQLLHLLSTQTANVNSLHSGILQHPRSQSSFVNGKSVMQTASDFILPPINQLSDGASSADNVERDLMRFKERQAQETPSNGAMTINPSPNPKGSTFVICEICDGYIKDLSQLKSHMQWIHKVKIHQKMLISRPPLNCQKCQWRFFTDQGLERHLLGAHGLVTSNMQELVDQGADSGRCTVCGRAYANKLVAHMKEVHKTNLKPAHLSYKCTVCSATFNLYRLFENHVYSVHSESVKRVSSN